MTTRPITEIAEAVARYALAETQAEDPRIGYAEIAVTNAEQPYLARWIFTNEEQGWRTSENYADVDDAVHAIALLPGGREWLTSYTPRVVDERSEVAATDPLGVSTNIADDMNPE